MSTYLINYRYRLIALGLLNPKKRETENKFALRGFELRKQEDVTKFFGTFLSNVLMILLFATLL